MALRRTQRSALLCCSLACLAGPAVADDGKALAAPASPFGRRAITVVELPVPAGLPGAPGQRAHHALSIATDAPKPFLRALGLTPSDCTMRFRLPSRFVPSQAGGAGAHVDVQAQAGLGCRF
jgi:hypothetical protein